MIYQGTIDLQIIGRGIQKVTVFPLGIIMLVMLTN